MDKNKKLLIILAALILGTIATVAISRGISDILQYNPIIKIEIMPNPDK